MKRQRRSLCFIALCQEAWDVIRKPYKTFNEKENRPKSFPRDCLP